MSDILKFKVSSGLKDIIGRELITDDFIAVFELVKNGFDARAPEVSITFNNIYGDKPSIVIEDNGKGMSLEDLTDKWLFVAYSAKREGTEEKEGEIDYRSKLRPVRSFAGAKGIGRFSCDRLGEYMALTTKQAGNDANVECIEVNWTDFEKNARTQFGLVPINHTTLSRSPLTHSHGTKIEITELRSKWDRSKLLRLKRSLEKLINPTEIDDDKSFSVIINAKDEESGDKKLGKNDPEKINGIIKNTVFERLKLKTTEIRVVIPQDGETIKTTLTDRGEKIYSITEINTSGLHDISISLFNLDPTAKASFTRLMGIEPVNFGSVFMYKNGFRIYPFGEVGDDSLGLDVRKGQGYARNLGTRELIGRIEINGVNEYLKETSSRVGGLIRNESYDALIKLFYEKALRRLEKYVVDVIKWGAIEDPITGEQREILPSDVKEDIIKVFAVLTSSKDVIDYDFDSKSFGVVESRQEKSLSKLVKNISRIAEESNNPNLSRDARIVAKRVGELQNETSAKGKALAKAEGELQRTVGENLFLRSVTTTEIKEVLGMQHQIGHSTQRIEDELTTLRESVDKGIDGKSLKSHLEIIALENKKIATIANFVTKANFSLNSVSITQDLVSFIVQYIENVYKDYPHLKVNRKLPTIIVTQSGSHTFRLKFSPLEIIIIIDNLLSNAQKAGARIVNVTISVEKGEFNLLVSDDGKGISEDQIDKIFDFGYTTTNGSGIGLYHVKQLVSKLHGKVKVVSNSSGTSFLITLKNEPSV